MEEYYYVEIISDGKYNISEWYEAKVFLAKRNDGLYEVKMKNRNDIIGEKANMIITYKTLKLARKVYSTVLKNYIGNMKKAIKEEGEDSLIESFKNYKKEL